MMATTIIKDAQQIQLLKKAVDQFSVAIFVQPNNIDFLYQRSTAYLMMGMFDHALEDTTKILR